MMFREGQQIGPYVLVRKLGKGGFGVVWLAEKRSQFLAKKVAVKLLDSDQVDFETIQREAVLWEEASGHPNVLPIIDAEAYDDQVVIVSEYAGSGSLHDQLQAYGKPPLRDAVEITIGILNGLDFLHGRKIIHRDIKPQNILLQGKTPRLADFGISRAMQTTAVSSTIIGTDAYMSPEAFDGKRSVQTDIWSVGVVLYQLLNGSLPFPQEHPSERMFAVLTKDFAPLADEVPAVLQNIVKASLAKLPENRFQTAAAMREALQRVLVNLDHPTFAKTEVFRAPALYQTSSDLHNIATSEPTEQETQVAIRSHYPLPATIPAISVATNNAGVWPPVGGSPPGGTVGQFWSSTSHEMKIAYVLLSIFVIGGLVLVSSALRRNILKSPTPSPTPYSYTPTPTPTPTPTRTPTPTPTPTGTIPISSSPFSTANRSPFCRGYVDGWNQGWDSIKGKSRAIDKQCPNEYDYKDRSYEAGRAAGYVKGLLDARK